MSEFIDVTEDVTIIETDDGNVEIIEVGVQGPPGPPGDPATNLVTSVVGETGDVTLEMMGLDLVDNTPDLSKPVSTLQQAALNTKATKLDMPQFSIPVRDGSQAGNGEANAYRAYAIAASNNSVAVRGATGTLQANTASAANDLTTKAQMDAADALRALLTGAGFTGTVTITASNPLELSTGGTTTRISGNNGDLTVVATSAGQFRLRRTATGLWIGNNVNAITPAQMLHVDGNARINGVDYIVGTGFPNGVVSAPVGSIYIDTNVTNGASSWIKRFGTGNTGWVVENGDTGWRDVTSIFTNLELVNGLDYGVQWRRTNGLCYIKARCQIANLSTVGHTLPSAMEGAAQSSPIRFNGQGVLTEVIDYVLQGSYAYPVPSSTATVGRRGYINASYDPSLPQAATWPATLPGTAV